ncbi:MAG: helix-turn-helix domain-containing protein [Cyanobacteria bacterium]|nr:helix-turn-helix domain-containing protein [Cyanobacteriota bacterium]
MLSFGCVEEVAEALAGLGLPLELTQLAPGALRSDLLALRFGALQVLRVRFDRALHIAGAKPGDRQLFTLELDPDPQAGLLRSHGQTLPAAAVFGMATHGEVHLTATGRRSLAVLAIDPARFQQEAMELGHACLDEQVFRSNWLPIETGRFQRLCLHLHQLFALSEAPSPQLSWPSRQDRLQKDLLPLLVEALAHAAGGGHRLPRSPARIDIVKQAQGWMARHPGQVISLDGICRELCTSRRSLIQGFQDHLGMGPMAFLKLQRLHGVRQTLLAADPQRTTIAAVAARFGFLSAGHFARDYRLLFGELPSITLAAGPKTRAPAGLAASAGRESRAAR